MRSGDPARSTRAPNSRFRWNPLNTPVIAQSIVVDGADVPRAHTEAQMRTIKLLGLAVALAAVSVSASAQGGRHMVGLNDYARLETRQIQGMRMHRRAMMAGMRGRMMGMRGQRFGMRGGMMGTRGRMMAQRGAALGVRGQHRAFARGRMMGYRAGINATPAQREFFRARAEQRTAIRAQVTAGKLTREQARTQMQAWAREHRPK